MLTCGSILRAVEYYDSYLPFYARDDGYTRWYIVDSLESWQATSAGRYSRGYAGHFLSISRIQYSIVKKPQES